MTHHIPIPDNTSRASFNELALRGAIPSTGMLAVSSIEHLAMTLRPSADWGETSFAMLSAYFDAGGHKSDQRYLVMAGFVSSAKDWVDFDGLWKARLAEDGLTYFHAVDFAHSQDEFKEGWRGNEPRRRKLLGDLVSIIQAHAFRKFVSVVENKTFTEHVSDDVQKEFHIKAYSLAGRSCALSFCDCVP